MPPSVYQHVGCFDARLFQLGEDVDYSLRAIEEVCE